MVDLKVYIVGCCITHIYNITIITTIIIINITPSLPHHQTHTIITTTATISSTSPYPPPPHPQVGKCKQIDVLRYRAVPRIALLRVRSCDLAMVWTSLTLENKFSDKLLAIRVLKVTMRSASRVLKVTMRSASRVLKVTMRSASRVLKVTIRSASRVLKVITRFPLIHIILYNISTNH